MQVFHQIFLQLVGNMYAFQEGNIFAFQEANLSDVGDTNISAKMYLTFDQGFSLKNMQRNFTPTFYGLSVKIT